MSAFYSVPISNELKDIISHLDKDRMNPFLVFKFRLFLPSLAKCYHRKQIPNKTGSIERMIFYVVRDELIKSDTYK